ncbi:hypothetical protein ACLB2K_037562 [Fragaria x ananassa]
MIVVDAWNKKIELGVEVWLWPGGGRLALAQFGLDWIQPPWLDMGRDLRLLGGTVIGMTRVRSDRNYPIWCAPCRSELVYAVQG